ncbi:hypothetical protein P167DRAFT_608797 [Morchella conica CCBAS932]|uniref:Uncharacterized protein n=1 Tax=Morchella conica CCBAS932 TaxID=1392247 RepID=A0A3N4KIX2_9PEZI|nr:hypothetical protein P167DRAFT_608797 [Morchella conica CCBAS932]
MKLTTFLSVLFYLALSLSIAQAAPIFGLWGSEPVLDVYDNKVESATFTLADAPKPEQNTGSLLSRFPIFDTLLPWGITKTETDDMMSIYSALSQPEKEVFVDALQEQVAIEKSSGGKVKLSWKSFFKRFWSWAKGLFRSW